MKKIKGIIAFIILSIVLEVGTVSAGVFTGAIEQFIVGGPWVYFRISGASYAGCAHQTRFVVDTTTVTGKNMYAQILSFYLAGKSMTVFSAGTCTVAPGDAEDVNNTSAP